jgi:hypothetical protein
MCAYFFFGQMLTVEFVSRSADGKESLFQARHIGLLEGDAKVEYLVNRSGGSLDEPIRNGGAGLVHPHCVESGVGPYWGNESSENEESSAHVEELLRLRRSRWVLQVFYFKPLYLISSLNRMTASSPLIDIDYLESASMRISVKLNETSSLNRDQMVASPSKFTPGSIAIRAQVCPDQRHAKLRWNRLMFASGWRTMLHVYK